MIPRKYELSITIAADDFESMLNLLHVRFQGVAAGTHSAESFGSTASSKLFVTGPIEELRREYLSYRDAADEEAR